MKGSVVALGQVNGRGVAARMVDGLLDDLLFDGPEEGAPRPGTIYRGVCDRPVKGQGGMMLRLPGGTGYLRGAKGLAPGQEMLVQVTGWAEPGKAIPVTDRVLFKSRYAIVTPGAPGRNISRQIKDEEERVRLTEIAAEMMEGAAHGLILRSSAAGADEEDIAGDIAAMRDLCAQVLGDAGAGPDCLVEGPDAHELAWREWAKPDLLDDAVSALEDHGAMEAIEALESPRVALSGGAFMFVEATRALVAVDVNTGADMSPAAALKANMAAVRALPRALRLRGLGGQISVDFAPLSKKDRKQMEHMLRAAFRADPVETALAGWTPLGHFELQRKRERLALHEAPL